MRKGLLVFGIILVLVGVGIPFYREPNVVFDIEEYHKTYPFAYIGMILFLAGVLLLMICVLFSFGKTEEMPQLEKSGEKSAS